MNASELVQGGQSGENGEKVAEQIYTLSMQCMRSSQSILPLDTYQQLLSRFEGINEDQAALPFLQQFMYSVLNYASGLKHQQTLLSRQDYQVLEKSLQKAQAEIRKHIKIEQQLKLYLDSLEERIEQLQDQAQLESQKYLLLFDSFKQLDQDYKKLQSQLSQPSELKRSITCQQPAENVASRKTKLGLKSRMLMERLQERTRKTNQRKRNKLLSITEDDVQGGSSQQMVYKKASIDRYGKQGTSHSSIKELTKSLQMKHERSVESYVRRAGRQRTETHKECRSNSIMH